jgi:hypothetical protein
MPVIINPLFNQRSNYDFTISDAGNRLLSKGQNDLPSVLKSLGSAESDRMRVADQATVVSFEKSEAGTQKILTPSERTLLIRTTPSI